MVQKMARNIVQGSKGPMVQSIIYSSHLQEP